MISGGIDSNQEANRHRAARFSLRLGSRRKLVGYVDDATIGGRYSGADLMVAPSLYEGIGLPLLEVMPRGAPVLASDSSTLPEVGGNVQSYAYTEAGAAWGETMVTLLNDPDEQSRLRETGLRHAGGFSWQRTAQSAWDVHREVAG